MAKLVFAVFIILVGFGARFLLRRLIDAYGRGPRPQPAPPTVTILSRAVPFGLWAIASLIVLFSIFVTVDAGYVGVVSVFGRVEPVPLFSGLHVIEPWKDVTQMSVQVQKHEGKYDAASIDIQAVHTTMTINFAIVPEKAPEIYQRLGRGYESSIIDPAANEVLKANTALHAANDILQQRPKIKGDVEAGLVQWLGKYGIVVKEVSIKDIRFDKDFELAVEHKQIAQQVAQQKAYEVQQATQDALSVVAKHKGMGDADKAEAQGKAEALRIRGAAEAEYNLKVAASLSPLLIQQRYLDRWNGQLPMYSLGAGGTLLQIPSPAPAGKVAER